MLMVQENQPCLGKYKGSEIINWTTSQNLINDKKWIMDEFNMKQVIIPIPGKSDVN